MEGKILEQLLKYPRTPHIEGSRLQPGDEDLSQISFSAIEGKHIVVEEKCDGANSAISFGKNGELLLQSRGHFLSGGYRERHYNLMKQWANVHKDTFYSVLGQRYIMYGEWMYAKHTVYYDALPHYFLEFDIWDKEKKMFLDTKSRHALLKDLPVVSVPVLFDGTLRKKKDLLNLLEQSWYIRDGHMEKLRAYCNEVGECADIRCGETDNSTLMEGLYIKVEQNGQVVDRMKYVRASFSQYVNNSEVHWNERNIIPNQLAFDMDMMFLPTLPECVKEKQNNT